jgi:Holliday junction resolvase
MRTRARVDVVQPALVKAFRDAGMDVLHTHQLGKGYPDLFVGWNGIWLAVEVKSDKGSLTKAQERLHKKLRIAPRIVRDTDDVKAACIVLWTWHRLIMGKK